MKRVTYGGGSVLTGDRIADALLDYAAILARAESADHVRVPAIGADDRPTAIDLLVGPASQLLAEPEMMSGEELVDAAWVTELERRGRLAAAGRADQIGRGG